MKRQETFDFLKRKGYVVCSLERKSYSSVEVEQCDVECSRCGNKWTAQFTKERKIMNAVDLNNNVSAAVLATSYTSNKTKNALSIRLRRLLNELGKEKYSLNYIDDIQAKIMASKRKRGRFGA